MTSEQLTGQTVAVPFKRPLPSGAVVGLARLALPIVLRRKYGIVRVEYRNDDLEALRSLSDARMLITPNHPTNAEPAVMFDLSKTVGQPFFYLSNREAFDYWGGAYGWLLQRVGAYSVMRGAPDRESFRMTRKLLSETPAKLVIFPEGEVDWQNETLLPFQAGVFQLAFFALDDMKWNEPLYILPVAIKYRFAQDMKRPISGSLDRLDRVLGLRGTPPSEPYARLRRAGDALIASAEATYGLERGSPENLDPRIEGIKEAMIARVATSLGVEARGSAPERMRMLMNTLFSVTREGVVPESVYDARLRMQERERIRPLLRDLQRLANWIAVRDNYVAEAPTQERYVETLRRMEIEVFGKPLIKGRRICSVLLGEAIDLRDYADSYAQGRRSTAHAVSLRVEDSVRQLLSGSDNSA